MKMSTLLHPKDKVAKVVKAPQRGRGVKVGICSAVFLLMLGCAARAPHLVPHPPQTAAEKQFWRTCTEITDAKQHADQETFQCEDADGVLCKVQFTRLK